MSHPSLGTVAVPLYGVTGCTVLTLAAQQTLGTIATLRTQLFAAFADPAWHTDTLAGDSITAIRVETITLLFTVDTPRTTGAVLVT